MSKKTFVIFGLLLAFLAIVVPFWAFERDGDTSRSDDAGKELFQTNCGNCHTLYAAGTIGDFGPNLDQKLAPAGPAADEQAADGIKTVVDTAIEDGADSPDVPGRMPPGIVTGTVAEEIAEFVAHNAGKG